MTPTNAERLYAALAGLTLLGGLAACGTDSDGSDDVTPDTDDDATADDSTTEDSGDEGDTEGSGDTTASDAEYADGTYTATGSYVSPGGQESVEVEITLDADVITAVTVTPQASNPNSQRYQGEFADGIADVVVGQQVDQIAVDRVAGSSLTSGGFNEALEQILAEASA